MKKIFSLLAAGAIALSPAMALAGPGGHGGGMGHGATMGSAGQGAAMGRAGGMGNSGGLGSMGNMGLSGQDPTHSSQGPINGKGWDHLNGPMHATGQPGAECEEIRPGHASSAPGSAFNPDGKSGTHYAGEQPQNSRNTSSVSQYDVACLNQEKNH